jgi:hypothetical protein
MECTIIGTIIPQIVYKPQDISLPLLLMPRDK